MLADRRIAGFGDYRAVGIREQRPHRYLASIPGFDGKRERAVHEAAVPGRAGIELGRSIYSHSTISHRRNPLF
jgi:hypothetical protein